MFVYQFPLRIKNCFEFTKFNPFSIHFLLIFLPLKKRFK